MQAEGNGTQAQEIPLAHWDFSILATEGTDMIGIHTPPIAWSNYMNKLSFDWNISSIIKTTYLPYRCVRCVISLGIGIYEYLGVQDFT
jgi:hypothetical protein